MRNTFFAFVALFCLATFPLFGQPVEFIVLQMNDVYEIAPLEGGKAGGLARVATVRQELLKENPNVITVLAGDFLSPSFLGTMRFENEAGEQEKIAGLQMIETLNAMGLDYVTFGNHEFDIKDPDVLAKRIAQSDFQWTVCNAQRVMADGQKRPFRQGGASIPPYILHPIKGENGQEITVGILGVVLPFNQIEYVDYAPVNEAFAATLKELSPQADFVMGITHLNVDEDEALAAAVPGVPLFTGGHEHANLSRYVGTTRITKADANAKTVYVHRVKVDPDCGMVSVNSTLRTIDDSIADEPKTLAVVNKWLDRAFEVMEGMGYEPEKEVLRLNETLVCKESAVRTSQTNFGQLTLAALEDAMPGADVYFINSGTMRLDDNLDGLVTEYDVLRTYPFGGKVVRVSLTGKVLQRALETGLMTNYGEGGYFQVRQVDPTTLTVKGEVIDPGKSYSVVLPEFVARGLEANLDFLGQYYDGSGPDDLKVGEDTVRNDIRDLVIHYMLKIGEY
ncbi:bifunctional UDP-sugar hydrolase/5'-nucleotidase [Lewinella sp. W8]|uniref:bifunctional metallophosphatase/5'-nucleotidase n=1 Tax=Lewinella sp. W8 TaxID=2528208 RepID=UPI0010687008|nr:bifunctional metallophosphatase/5'-nucleotidase [Lewinella sp. W8]MTB52838.1 bifunctional metallophosphatase/5'-nucleotidase [Lewinella sp. W8]